MNARLRRRISRARRALDFATAHPLTDSGYAIVVARLQAEIDQADALGILQGTGDEREHAAVVRRQEVKKTTGAQLLRRLCRIGEVAAAGHPELANKFVLPRKPPTRVFILKAQAMLADATADQELLRSIGLGDTFIAELTQAVADLDSTTDSAHTARNDHVGATGGLPALADRCEVDIDILDTFIEVAFANDAQALTAWRSAKNLAGPFKAQTPEEVPPVTPEPESVVAQPVAPQPVVDPPADRKE
jgi:hypothetical protein